MMESSNAGHAARPWVETLSYPKGFASHVTPFSFALISDPHCDETPSSSRHSLGYEYLGDGKDRLRRCFEAIATMKGQEQPAFAFLLGDIGMDTGASVLAEAPCPVHAVAGNHDWGTKRQRLRELFPDDFGIGDRATDYYRFEFGGVVFLAICNAGVGNEHTGQLSSEDIRPPGQASWISRQMAQTRGPAVLIGHCPPQPTGFDPQKYLADPSRRYLPFLGECDSVFLNGILSSANSVAAFFGHQHCASIHYRVGSSVVHVLRSCNWNHDHQPVGFLTVQVSRSGIRVREILTGLNDRR